jgi:hypothetical protein
LNIRQGPQNDRRRSQRVMLSVAVRVSGTNANGVAFAEDTATVVVNADGGMVLLKSAVRIGQQLNLRNINTSEDALCVAIDANTGSNEAREVGMEFVAAAPRFWRVSFPPIDWSSRSPEAKRHGNGGPVHEPTPSLAAKK